MRRLRESFRPEFLNRIDEIIIFRQLGQEELRQITELLLEETRRKLHAQDVTVDFTPAAVDWIAERGYQPEFGARPMRRTIQREVDNELSRLLLDGQIGAGQEVTVDDGDGRLTFAGHDRPAGVPGRAFSCETLAAAAGHARMPAGNAPRIPYDGFPARA